MIASEWWATVIIAFLIGGGVSVVILTAIVRRELHKIPMPDGPSELTDLFLADLEYKRQQRVVKRLGRDWLRGGR